MDSSGASSSSGGGVMHTSGLPMTQIADKDAKIFVWIDLENYPIPSSVLAMSQISCNIVKCLRQLGYNSNNISIKAYTNINSISIAQRTAINLSGITLSHVDHTWPDAVDHKMLVDFRTWAQVNSSPANILIVSGDTGYWPTMKTLKEHGYNIMMACRPTRFRNSPPANTIMCWNQLMIGTLSRAKIF